MLELKPRSGTARVQIGLSARSATPPDLSLCCAGTLTSPAAVADRAAGSMNEPTLPSRPSRKCIVKAHPITQSEGPIRALGLRRNPQPAFRWSTLPADLCSGDENAGQH